MDDNLKKKRRIRLETQKHVLKNGDTIRGLLRTHSRLNENVAYLCFIELNGKKIYKVGDEVTIVVDIIEEEF